MENFVDFFFLHLEEVVRVIKTRIKQKGLQIMTAIPSLYLNTRFESGIIEYCLLYVDDSSTLSSSVKCSKTIR